MPDDFDSTGGDLTADLDAAFDGLDAGATDAPAELPDRHPDDEAWRIKSKDAPAADGEDPAELSVRDALEAEFDKLDLDKQTTEAAKTFDAELTELTAPLADQMQAAKLDARGVVRNLFDAERRLREAPAETLATLAQSYGANLDHAGKLRAAAGILGALGLSHAGQLGEADRAQLQQYQSQESQRARALEAARPQVEQEVAAFAAQHPDFQQLRPLMGSIVSAGQARDLATAYDMARRASGLPDRAQAADQARRDKLARVKAASTPRTMSSNARSADPKEADKSVRQLLEETWDELGAGA